MYIFSQGHLRHPWQGLVIRSEILFTLSLDGARRRRRALQHSHFVVSERQNVLRYAASASAALVATSRNWRSLCFRGRKTRRVRLTIIARRLFLHLELSSSPRTVIGRRAGAAKRATALRIVSRLFPELFDLSHTSTTEIFD